MQRSPINAGRVVRGAVAGFFGCLLWASVLYAFAQALAGAFAFARLDLSLPSSLKELVNGIILAGFISFPIGICVVALVLAVRFRRDTSVVGRAALLFVGGFFLWGGILVLVIPTWTAVVAASLGISIAVAAVRKC
jgi:hypothetical protein